MIRLDKKPFNLHEEDINWVVNTLANMTLEEKVGQLFCIAGSLEEEKDIKEFLEKYKPGGMMYRP